MTSACRLPANSNRSELRLPRVENREDGPPTSKYAMNWSVGAVYIATDVRHGEGPIVRDGVLAVGTQTRESVRGSVSQLLAALSGALPGFTNTTGPRLFFSLSHLQRTAIMAPSNSFREVIG
jgi:hypothetical protein